MRALNVFNNVDIVFPVKLTESERIESENFQSFREFYTELRKNFDSVGRLHEISGSSCSQLDWPDGIGVYVIRKLNFEDIIYVGMTGKVKRTQEGQVLLEDKKNGFKSRRSRWYPYCFTEEGIFKDHFEFGPNFGVNELKNEPKAQRYKYHIPFDEIAVDCFILGNESKCTPTFLEGFILQNYFFQKETLPMANNIL